jgi:hypothetical protein
VPANVLVLHPGLERIAVPLCRYRGLHGAADASPVDVVLLGTPGADAALLEHAVASGFVVAQPGR